MADFARRNKNDENPIREAFGQCTVPRTRPNCSQSCPSGVPGASRTLPGRFRDRLGAARGLSERIRSSFFALRSRSGVSRAAAEWTLIVPNCPNTSFRRFVVEFSSYLHRSGNLLVRFSSDLVRCPARLSVRFSCFAGPPRYAGRSMFDDLLRFASICDTVSDNRVRIALGPATGGEVLLPGASSPPFCRHPLLCPDPTVASSADWPAKSVPHRH